MNVNTPQHEHRVRLESPVTPEPVAVKKVSFQEHAKVFDIDRIDSSLIDTLYYGPRDIRRFRQREKMSEVCPPSLLDAKLSPTGPVRKRIGEKFVAAPSKATTQEDAIDERRRVRFQQVRERWSWDGQSLPSCCSDETDADIHLAECVKHNLKARRNHAPPRKPRRQLSGSFDRAQAAA